jgi:glycosyltransferase involved in cell wall biosynthesis
MKIGLVGDVNSLFIRQQAKLWASKGLDVEIICYYSGLKEIDGIKVNSSFYKESKWFYLRGVIIRKILFYIERLTYLLFKKKYENALGTAKNENISFAYSLICARSLKKFIDNSDFSTLFVHDVFAFGFICYLLRESKIRKVIFPWGGDIYMYKNTSFFADLIVRKSIQYADFICPTSQTAADYIRKSFKVKDLDFVEAISWGVDVELIDSIIPDDLIFNKYEIPKDKKIISNIRRFLPSWGSSEVFESFLELSIKREDLHFVLIGNKNSSENFTNPKQLCIQNNVRSKFTFIDENISFSDYISILKISTIGVSFMIEKDMRSFSILQSFYCGCYLILSDQEEYHTFKNINLEFSIVKFETNLLIKEIQFILDKIGELEPIKIKNRKSIFEFENNIKNQNYLISKVMDN